VLHWLRDLLRQRFGFRRCRRDLDIDEVDLVRDVLAGEPAAARDDHEVHDRRCDERTSQPAIRVRGSYREHDPRRGLSTAVASRHGRVQGEA
jgi:hypothetical protein